MELRTQFSTELERARRAGDARPGTGRSRERRSLRELDAERTARQKSERTAEALRGELVAARSEARDAAVAQAEVRARLEAQSGALADRLASAEQAQRKSAHDLDAVQAELGVVQRRAERTEAEERWRASCRQNCGWRHPGGERVVVGGGARPPARRRPQSRTTRRAKNKTKYRTKNKARLPAS